VSVDAATGRARAHRHAVHATICDRTVPWEHGTAVFATDLRTFFAYNSVRVEDAAHGVTAQELATTADRIQAGLAHRQVEVDDERAGERLRPGFESLGWHVDRHAWMELEGAAHGASQRVEVVEVPFRETRALRETWFATSPWFDNAAAVRRFLAVEERAAQRRGTRALLARGAGGEAVGFAALSVTAGSAEVEQVEVVEGRRGEGIGAALVRAAVEAAGAPRTWIVADDEGDAKRLYARLGFVPAWVQHVFTRAPALRRR